MLKLWNKIKSFFVKANTKSLSAGNSTSVAISTREPVAIALPESVPVIVKEDAPAFFDSNALCSFNEKKFKLRGFYKNTIWLNDTLWTCSGHHTEAEYEICPGRIDNLDFNPIEVKMCIVNSLITFVYEDHTDKDQYGRPYMHEVIEVDGARRIRFNYKNLEKLLSSRKNQLEAEKKRAEKKLQILNRLSSQASE